MDNFIQVETASLDALIKQVHDLNIAFRESRLQLIYTEILDGNEAAQYLKVTPRYLQSLRGKNELCYFQIGSLIRYKRADLDKWLNAHQVGQ